MKITPGRIIFLNGSSSSGKSTLAAALRDALETPFWLVSSDQFADAGMLPKRRDRWVEEMRPKFFDGFHRCLPALADAGNDLVVEHIIEYPAWRDSLQQLLGHLDVFYVGVHCAADEVDRREKARGDRRIGEGRAHLEENKIHTFMRYDFEVDTTAGVSPDLVEEIRRAWNDRGRSTR